jgi:hypothetical protein
MARLRLLAIALFMLATPAFAKGPPKPLPDWPCETPFAGPLEPSMLWPGATPQPEGVWLQDPTARPLVEFLTAGENSPAMGEREIEDVAAKRGALGPETALLVVAGMVERGNKLRLILLAGIKQQIIRSHVLADAIASDQAKLDAVAKQGSDDASLKEALRQNTNGLDDANDTAEHLCHRLVYDETKLRRLADRLKQHTR